MATLTIYDESLAPGWTDSWSWDSIRDLANTSHPNTGKLHSIAWAYTNAWGGLYLHKNSGGISTQGYTALIFALRASEPGQSVQVQLYDDSTTKPELTGPPVPLSNYGGDPVAETYKSYAIPLADLHGTNRIITGIAIQDASRKPQPPMYLDTISLT